MATRVIEKTEAATATNLVEMGFLEEGGWGKARDEMLAGNVEATEVEEGGGGDGGEPDGKKVGLAPGPAGELENGSFGCCFWGWGWGGEDAGGDEEVRGKKGWWRRRLWGPA